MAPERYARLRRTAENIAEASGAKAEVTIIEGYPVTVDNVALAEFLGPVLRHTVGTANVGSVSRACPPRTSRASRRRCRA